MGLNLRSNLWIQGQGMSTHWGKGAWVCAGGWEVPARDSWAHLQRVTSLCFLVGVWSNKLQHQLSRRQTLKSGWRVQGSQREWSSVCLKINSGKQSSALGGGSSAGGDLLTSTGNNVRRWIFHRAPHSHHHRFHWGSRAWGLWGGLSITQAEVAEVVRKLLGAEAPGGWDLAVRNCTAGVAGRGGGTSN